MENFVKYTAVAILLLFAWIPLLAGMVDIMLKFLFDYTLLSWTSNRIMFVVAWTLLPSMVLSSFATAVAEV